MICSWGQPRPRSCAAGRFGSTVLTFMLQAVPKWRLKPQRMLQENSKSRLTSARVQENLRFILLCSNYVDRCSLIRRRPIVGINLPLSLLAYFQLRSLARRLIPAVSERRHERGRHPPRFPQEIRYVWLPDTSAWRCGSFVLFILFCFRS